MALKLIGQARFVVGEGTDASPYRRVVVDNTDDLTKLPKHIADELRAAGVLVGEAPKAKPKPKAE